MLGTAHSPGTHTPQVLAPMLEPCKLRWVRYNDYYTGQELLGACLASFELESPGAQTSCKGGLSGLGDVGDSRVPKLIGVGCVDMNLVVDLPTLESHAGYNDFWAEVQSDMKACPRNTLTEAQMETLRFEAGGAPSMCNSVHSAHNDTDCHDGEDCEDEGEVIGAVIGAIVPVVIIAFVGFAIFRVVRAKQQQAAAAGAARTAARGPHGLGPEAPPAALPAAQPQQQIQMQHQASVPVCQGAVVSAYPQATAGYPQATAGYPQATAGYPQAAQPPVMMGQVVS